MMVRIRFLPEDKVVDVEQGLTILEAAQRAQVVIESPCNGAGICGKCRVRLPGLAPGAVRESASSRISDEDEGVGFYSACHTEVYADLTVERLDGEGRRLIEVLKEGESLPVLLDPFVRKEFLERERETHVYAGQTRVTVEQGDTRDRTFGLAVDIGTTTLVASLIDLTTGQELSSVSSLNPQSLHAQDVLSRIKRASTDEGLRLMHMSFAVELNRMVGQMTATTGVKRENIYEAVYSGNTCMLHLACAVDPGSLGRHPYKPSLNGDEHLPASVVGLSIAPEGLVYLPPIISGFVGADITSGILATGFHADEATTLFADIGTNGEMVLCHRGRLLAASAAAGPAFEGMNISCGMRARVGAVEEVVIDPAGSMTVKTVGGAEATGICGSGLLDAIAGLVRHGLVTREGRLLQSGEGNGGSPVASRLGERNGSRAFFLTDSVYVSQKDVRQVQLAKGAMRTGIEFLLKHAGVEAWQVDSVLVAGAFGYHARVQSLVDVGLLPESFLGKIRLVGNTSKSGGIAYLLDRESRGRMRSVAERTKVIELADCAGFDRAFVHSLAFDKRKPGAGVE